MEVKQFDFGEALSFLKSGLKVTNPRGNVLFMENGKVLYSQGILDKANVVINFFPKKEQSDLQNAFSDLKIFFADYAPEVFEPIPNISMYNQIINTSLSEV